LQNFEESINQVLNNITESQSLVFGIIFTFIMVFIATFFNFAISYVILEYLKNKKNISFSESLEFSFSRLKDISV
jgi:hypothetical protein